jgi:hypothetical protein
MEEFERGLTDGVKELSEILEGFRRGGYQIIFNLTGGYKSVNSFLQTMATLWAQKSIYIFEGSQEVLEIPQLPLKLDQQVFERYFHLFKKLPTFPKIRERGRTPSLVESYQLPIHWWPIGVKIGEMDISPFGENGSEKAEWRE